MHSTSVPMSWVWERFRNTFRSSADDDVEEVEIDTRPSQHREVAVYGAPGKLHDEGVPGTAGTEESVTTCSACRVTIHHHQQPGPRLRAACPFCGQPYSTNNTTTTTSQQTEHPPVGVGVGAGRVHGQRSCSDPIVPSFRLPAIQEPSPEHRPQRYGRIGSFMVSRLGNVNITNLGNFLLRPGSDTSLPPISKDSDGKNSGFGLSPVSTPESGFRSALSVENLTSSEPDEARASPHYPTRNKTREDFL